jgi:hypothetical protein
MRDASRGGAVRAKLSGSFVRRSSLLAGTALVALGACSDGNGSASPPGGTAGAGGAAGGTGGSAGTVTQQTAGVGGSAMGASGGTGGQGAAGGAGGAGGAGAAGGVGGSVAGTGGSSGGVGTAGKGGSSGAGGSVGGAGGVGAGGMPAGSGGQSGGGSGAVSGSGGGSSECTRELLKGTIDTYFKALAAHDATMLPTSADVKFTENAKVMKLGMDGLWKTAGALKHVHSLLDVAICSTASEAVVPDGSTDIPFALRLKLVGGKITEIETIAVRDGDYKVSGSNFASDTGAIISSAMKIGWEDPVPADMAPTRDELVAWMDKYFKYFPNGVCNTDSSCKRIENGGGNFSCSAGASCSTGSPPTKPQAVSHALLGDPETGIGAGFDVFTGADIDMHMFKMKGGKVYAVDAVLGAATSSGWE